MAFTVASPLRTSNLHNNATAPTPTGGKSRKGSGQDRFIPPRGALDLEALTALGAVGNAENDNAAPPPCDAAMSTPGKRQYVRRLAENLNVSCPGDEKVKNLGPYASVASHCWPTVRMAFRSALK